jgi:hypothetical protein
VLFSFWRMHAWCLGAKWTALAEITKEQTKMINRSLSKRLQELEARLIPTEEPRVMQIQYVSPDGSVRDGPLYRICNSRPPGTRFRKSSS